MKKVYISMFWVLVTAHLQLKADNRIIIYIRHAPPEVMLAAEQEANTQSITEKLKGMEAQSAGTVSRNMVGFSLRRYMTPPLSGITAVYAGYRDISDPDGLISFPLRHATPKVYIAITPHIRLANVMGNTYSHREFIADQENPVQMYSFEHKQDEKGVWFWDVQMVPVPEDKIINPLAIVILAHPKNIYIAQKHTWSPDNPQLVLPDLYLVGDIDPEINLRFLDIEYLFEPITVEQKKISDTTAQKLITNV